MIDDPFGANREQLVSLWSVSDAAKKFVLFERLYRTKGTHRREAAAAFLELARELDILDAYRTPKATKQKAIDEL